MPEDLLFKEYAECAVCGSPAKLITPSHLKKHGMTMEVYRKAYSEAPVVCRSFYETLEKRLNKGRETQRQLLNENPLCRKKLASYGMLGKTQSLESRLQISRSMGEAYEQRKKKPPTAGKKWSEEEKKKRKSVV